MIGFIAIAVLVTVAAIGLVVVPLFCDREDPAPVAAVIAAVGIPAAVLLLYASLTSYPWAMRASAMPARNTPSSGSGQEGPDAPRPDAPDIAALRKSADEHPDDINSWLVLGQGYVETDRFADAKSAYRRALEIQSDNIDAELGLAEAEVLEDRNAMAGEPGRVIESVLKRDPVNAKALWYGGMVALSRGDNDTVRFRWGQLLQLGPPPQVRHVIEQQLKLLDSGQGAGMAPAASAASPSAAANAGETTGLAIHVSLDATLRSRVPSGAPLFVFARDPDRPGPPVAVVRHSASELPATIELTDANMMVPGQTLSGLGKVRLTARISGGGGPIAAPGDLYGEILWTAGGAKGPAEIIINRVVGTN